MSPTISSKKPKTRPRGLQSQQSMEREKLILLVAAIALGASLLIHLVAWIVTGMVRSNARDRELEEMRQEQTTRLAELDENFAEKVKMVERERKERLSVKNREAEYNKRWNWDPAFAESDYEKALLKMRGLAGSRSLDKAGVRKLAEWANPYPFPGEEGAVEIESERRGRGLMLTIRVDLEAFKKDIRGDYLIRRADGREMLHGQGFHNRVYELVRWMIYDVMVYGHRANVYRVRVHCQQRSDAGRQEDVLVISGWRKPGRTVDSPDFIDYREEKNLLKGMR